MALAVCTDLDADSGGIANLLGLPALAPTGSSLTTPVEVVFSEVPAAKSSENAYMETQYFVFSGINCRGIARHCDGAVFEYIELNRS
jgi:hypothetical protein